MKTLSERITKYSGPPGTGKSTTLLNVVDELLATGAAPEDILFTTFTRAGAYEARDRACARFKLPEKAFPYFRTLHSICFSELRAVSLMEVGDWCAIGKKLGTPFGIKFSGPGRGSMLVDQEGFLSAGTRADALLGLWSLARARLLPLDEVLKQSFSTLRFPDITLQELKHFADSVASYKREFGKMDYTDILERYLETGAPLGIDYAIIDEAQDLSALQWKVVEKLCMAARKIWIAGDDDQCIHAWNGADVDRFIELESAEHSVLPLSHRVPADVHKVAQQVIARVHKRIPKEYRPRNEPGLVRHIPDLEGLNLRNESWLLLARNQVLLREYIELCKRQGVFFSGANAQFKQSNLDAIAIWNRLVSGKEISKDEALVMYAVMSTRERVQWGTKKVLQESSESTFDYAKLVEKYGLRATKDLPWQQALDLMDEGEMLYISKAMKNDPSGVCRVVISTIHGAKGKEADNVVIRPEMTQRTFNGYEQSPDAEHRVWYVGVTRARTRLFIVNSTSDLCYPL